MNRKFVILSALMAICLLALIACGVSEPKNTLEKIQKTKELTIATHPFNPPFELGAGTGVEGFDYDLVMAIAGKMGVKTKWIKKDFDQCFEYLQNREVDMVVNAVTITPGRTRNFLFSEPYFQTGQVIAVRKEREDILTKDDLKGKKIGVQRNTTAEQLLKDLGEGQLEIATFDSIEEALRELNRKLLDAAVGDAPTIRYDLNTLANLKVVGDVMTKEEYGLVFRLTDVELKNEMDRIIGEMRTSGELQKLLQKWNLE